MLKYLVQVYYKFRHHGAKKKNEFRGKLQKYEYLWGVARTAESGLEASFQGLLQTWLLSFDFRELSALTFGDIFSKAIDGLIYWGTFGMKSGYANSTETEKSLGKVRQW